MNENKKIKLVIIMHSELVQRWIDYFCLDTLNKHFDLEYWDCSDFVLPGFHFDKKVERDYVRKIHSIWELWSHLRRLPKDTLISNDVHFNKSNYFYHKLLSHYFPKINHISFYSNTQENSLLSETTRNGQKAKKKATPSLKERIKRLIYCSRTIKFAIKYILYHSDSTYREKIVAWYEQNMYETYYVSCEIGAKYKINHPDVEKYFIIKDSRSLARKKYMVYIDQFFPYHPDFIEVHPELDSRRIAEDFYPSINHFFQCVEEKFNCEVIIAAHPLSNFKVNPYEGREMIYNKTAELVEGSIGVLMHSSNAISYAVLFRKPIILITNKQTKMIPYFNNQIMNLYLKFGIPLIDLDIMNTIEILPLKEEIYKKYIETYFGDIDVEQIIPNSILLVNYLKLVWHDIYDNYK